MGVDYNAVCFLGWEIDPPAEVDDDDEDDDPRDFVDALAEEHNMESGVYGDGNYGGEDYYLLGYQLHSQDLTDLKQCIATLETHPLCAKYGPPKIHCGVHMW
jgi:hypothetical protein